MKVIIIVTTYLDNAIYSKFYQKQNETWNSIDVDNVKVYFNINNGMEKGIDGHFIINNLSESYLNAASKIINCFEQTINEDYDYIFHTNSSSYVDKKLLYEWLIDKPRHNFYSGFIGNHNGILFASGAGFSISKDLVTLSLEKKEEWLNTTIFDVDLGKTLTDFGIKIYPAPRKDFSNGIFHREVIPTNYFHYRCKSFDRNIDLENMQKIFEMKKNK